MKRDLGPSVLAGFGLVALVLVLGAALSFRNTYALHENDRAVARTHEVLLEVEGVLSTVKDAETGQRGYVITGAEEYLQPYKDAHERVHKRLERLKELTHEDKPLGESIDELEQRVERKFTELEHTVTVRRQEGFGPASKVVATNRGYEEMQAIRQLTAEIELAQLNQLRIRAENSARSYQIAQGAVFITVAVGLLAITVAFALIRRELLARSEAEAALRQAHAVLEERVQQRTADLASTNDALRQEVVVRKETEERARTFAVELQRSNQELERFASVASHDLQEPLRKIQAFGDRLQSKTGHLLDDAGREYLARMRSAAARMRTLIDDLLTFSRVGTRAQNLALVDLGQEARQVVSDLETRIQQADGRVEIGSLATIQADPVQMRQLLQNLIANGLKFHRPGVPPVVRVEGRFLGGDAPNGDSRTVPGYEITVSDNGIGFEEVYLDRIFELFQRLHGRNEYEGTGIGLAICRKIVERHGGTITAHSTPGQGATFIVNLPSRPITQEGTP